MYVRWQERGPIRCCRLNTVHVIHAHIYTVEPHCMRTALNPIIDIHAICYLGTYTIKASMPLIGLCLQPQDGIQIQVVSRLVQAQDVEHSNPTDTHVMQSWTTHQTACLALTVPSVPAATRWLPSPDGLSARPSTGCLEQQTAPGPAPDAFATRRSTPQWVPPFLPE